jgi:CRISPR system Cascade subunit CasE
LLSIESKVFAPVLRAGDHLGFSLRANPTVQSRQRHDQGGKTSRHDVVMAALKPLPADERGRHRASIIARAGYEWLAARAERSGFALAASRPPDLDDNEDDPGLLTIDGYEQWRFRRIGEAGRISVLEFDGILRVTDPERLLTAVASGIGRARSFGCGLMLLRRL